jgi:hypothetical protein
MGVVRLEVVLVSCPCHLFAVAALHFGVFESVILIYHSFFRGKTNYSLEVTDIFSPVKDFPSMDYTTLFSIHVALFGNGVAHNGIDFPLGCIQSFL